ncbi:MAG: phytanoyl-CoA dioxygenase family protein [Caldilineaceae bacterium]
MLATQSNVHSNLCLTSAKKEVDTAPASFGELTDCTPLLGDADALRRHMREEGYLLLRGLLNREEVQAARLSMLERLAEQGHIDLDYPLNMAKAAPTTRVAFKPDIAAKNPLVQQVVYAGPLMTFFDQFLGGATRHFDYTWIRAVAPGLSTPPHMDVVYMGRGTQKLYTAWTPYGDVPRTMGGLMVLERSHRIERLVNGYGSKDVDKFCENKVGKGYTKMGGGGNITPGGWLSRDPVTLRKRLGGRWLTTDYQMGDVLIFSVFLVHCSLDNQSDCIRLTSDTRYQLASEPVDERWIGENPIAHGPEGKQGMIC